MKKCFIAFTAFLSASLLFAAPDLSLSAQDIAAVRGDENGISSSGNGIHLFIKKKEGVGSVLLVEAAKDPSGKEENFAYRALEWNRFNGDEIRMLDGKVLQSKYAMYSLVSSTVETFPPLGECFHIYLPPEIQFGYPWTRNGTVTIGKGTYINFRTFEMPYADYTGGFQDNPFVFDFPEPPAKKDLPVNIPLEEEISKADEPDLSEYSTEAAEKFNEIAEKGGGLLTYSKGPESLPEELYDLLQQVNPKDKLDVVFAIDTTGSMKDDMDMLRSEWVPCLIEQAAQFSHLRIGLILYRDYTDDYHWHNLPVKFHDFTESIGQFSSYLDAVVIKGNEGGDEPEAVYEALYAALNYYEWDEDAVRKVILIGDAEPHARPRGTAKRITQSMVLEMAAQKNIQLDCIIVPNKI